MMQVLFDQTKEIQLSQLILKFGTENISRNYISYFITNATDTYGVGYTLSVMVD
jgi:subfamily B ATP-binding cassette protein MsbA